jgi:hypothetical protein
MFLTLLSARGLAREALDPWRAWVVFKQYARCVDETPDPGVSVQITRDQGSAEATLFLIRQVLEPQDHWLEPVGGVVCELTFTDPPATVRSAEFWTFDTPTFERFVDLVEGDPGFADLIARRPSSSAVYWEEA